MLSSFEKVKQFHKKFGVPMRDTPGFPDDVEAMVSRGEKIEEELFEFREEMTKLKFEGLPETEDERNELLTALVSEAVDVIYTFYGMMVSCGVNADEVFDAIHKANMTKTLEGSKIKRGANFIPANIKNVIFQKNVYDKVKSPWWKEPA